jgi:hypothetical protein
VVLLAVVLVLVAGLGITVSGPMADAEPTSHSERAQLAAERTARELAGTAALLAESTSGKLSGQFSRTADVLQKQAAALDHPVYSPGPVPAPSASVEPAAGTADPARFLSLLAGSVRTNLESAQRADPGIARLLASTAAGQWVQVVALAQQQQMPTPQLLLPVADSATDPEEPGHHCGGAPVPDEAQLDALRAAIGGEHMAVYAYEVAAALAEDPEPLLAGAGLHAETAAAGEALLRGLCAEVPPAVAAYSLDERFRRNPAAALMVLEQELVRMYADLTGLSEVPVRDWAADRLRIGAQRMFEAGTTAGTRRLPAFPGLRGQPPA